MKSITLSRRVRVKAAVLTVGAVTVACTDAPSSEKAPPPAVLSGTVSESRLATVTLTMQAVRRLGIEVAALDSTVVAPTLTIGGEVVIPPGRAFTINAPVAGTVYAPPNGTIPVGGARVSAGQTLLQLVALPPDPGRTQQDLSVAEARLRQAQLEADRVAALFADRLVARREQERAQADLEAAKAAFDLASGQQRAAHGGSRSNPSALNAILVSAPERGIVRIINVGSGQAVAAGAILAEIVQLEQLWVRVPLYPGDAARVNTRAEATAHGLGSASSMPLGRAIPVAAPPSADPLASTVDLFYELRGAALRPGERVSMTLPLATGVEERAVTAPLSAIVRDMYGGAWVYEQVDSVTYSRRRVDVLRVLDGRAVLARAPTVGTRVVVAGTAELFGTEFDVGK